MQLPQTPTRRCFLHRCGKCNQRFRERTYPGKLSLDRYMCSEFAMSRPRKAPVVLPTDEVEYETVINGNSEATVIPPDASNFLTRSGEVAEGSRAIATLIRGQETEGVDSTFEADAVRGGFVTWICAKI